MRLAWIAIAMLFVSAGGARVSRSLDLGDLPLADAAAAPTAIDVDDDGGAAAADVLEDPFDDDEALSAPLALGPSDDGARFVRPAPPPLRNLGPPFRLFRPPRSARSLA